MTDLPALIQQSGTGLALFIDVPEHKAMLDLIAQLALNQPVRVVVGGNRFRAFDLTRTIRRHTVQVDTVLQRIQLARPFTCYQTLALFEELSAVAQPLVVLDLLDTFTDENITAAESYRLTRQVIQHLNWLKAYTAVIVHTTTPPQTDRAGLIDLLIEAADYVLQPGLPEKLLPLTLF